MEAEKEAKGEDTGFINLDTMTILVPRANNKKMIVAVEAAGLITSGARVWMGKRYFINPPKCGQSSSRKRAVQAMSRVMKNCGWEVLIHSETEQMIER